MLPCAGSARWPILLAASALACLVGAVFFPILGFEFVDIDVGQQVVDNPYIRGLTGENLKHIFSSRCIYSYYPIRTLSFAVDYQLWGLNPTGFKLTNGLVHLANVLLVFWLILRLLRHPASAGRSPGAWWDVSVATFSAGIFAVHPAVVEPVVWVAGREELLMTLGALGCIHFHLTARRLGEHDGKKRRALACYVGAALCCAAACLSNAVAAVIPLLIVAWDVLTLARPKLWRILCGTSALWVISGATVVIKKLGANPEGVAAQPGLFSVEWVTLVLNTYWVNMRTLAWPTNLAVSYSPLRPEGLLAAEVILGAVAIGLTGVLLWSLRRRKLILYGLFWFGLALAPASQVMSHHVHHADRFLYLPLVGLVMAVAVWLKPLGNALRRRGQWAGLAAAAVLGAFLFAALSAGQVQTWQSSMTMWEHCLKVDPNNAKAHDLFGNLLTNRGQLARAKEHYRKAMELDSDNPEALQAVAMQLACFEDERLRNYPEAIRMARRACELSRWEEARYLRTLATVYSVLAESQAAGGQFGPAIRNYKSAVEADPTFAPALYNLALILATCPDDRLRNPEAAVPLAERAYQLTEHPEAAHLSIIVDVYAAAGRLDKASTIAEKGVRSAQAEGNRGLADDFRRRLKIFHDAISSDSSRR